MQSLVEKLNNTNIISSFIYITIYNIGMTGGDYNLTTESV